ncbi:MAG: ABC transporter permease [Dehalococcoidia bacterium]
MTDAGGLTPAEALLLDRAGRMSPLGRARRAAGRRPLLVVGGVALSMVALAALAAPALSPHDAAAFSGPPNLGPGGEYLLGTDRFGRDILSRVLYGARSSMLVALPSVAAAIGIALVVGCYSGFRGGRVDLLLQRVVDVFIAFPTLVLLLLVVRIFDPSVVAVVIALTVALAPWSTRLVRGAALVEARSEHVAAAVALGATDTRIVLRHVVPGVLSLAIVLAATLSGAVIVAEASLSFLGLGVPPPRASWGADISASRAALPINLWAALFPGLAITIAVLGFNLLGDGLRDLLDPRTRNG